MPVPVAASGDLSGPRDVAAITYGAHWRKKGLDRVLAAWAALAAPEGCELLVAGLEEDRVHEAWRAARAHGAGAGEQLPAGVRVVGVLPPTAYRALLRRARVFVTAPRREDYGIAQLEALADGCALVTTAAPGPYAALGPARALDAGWVVERGDDVAGLTAALRSALQHEDSPSDRTRAMSAYTRAEADRRSPWSCCPASWAGRRRALAELERSPGAVFSADATEKTARRTGSGAEKLAAARVLGDS